MQKSQREGTSVEGDLQKGVKWEFPISEIAPKNLIIALGRTSSTLGIGTDLVYVSIEGLMRPNCVIPDNGPCYIGEQTKDPILYAMAQSLLGVLEQETKSTVTFTSAGEEALKKGSVIVKKPNNSADGSFFRLETWSFDDARRFSSADADEVFLHLERVIDDRVPQIEAKIAECVQNRPALLAQKFAIDDPTMHQEFARVELAKAAQMTTAEYDDLIKRNRPGGDPSTSR